MRPLLSLAVAVWIGGCAAPTSQLPPESQVRVPEESESLDGSKPRSTPTLVPTYYGNTDPHAAAMVTENYAKIIGPQLDRAALARQTKPASAEAPPTYRPETFPARSTAVEPPPATMKQPVTPANLPASTHEEVPATQWPAAKVAGANDASATALKKLDATAAANQGETIVKPTPASLLTNTQGPARIAPDENTGAMFAPAAGSDLESKLSRQVQEYPHDLWAQMDYQFLHVIRNEPSPLNDTSSSLVAEDREVLSAVMDGLMLFRNHLRERGNMLPSDKVRPLLEMADRLRTQANLSIPTLALCTRVDGFSVYEPIDPARFTVGREHNAIIYCEVENFSSTASPAAGPRMWETKLSQEAVLYTESGLEVWTDKTSAVVDRSRSRRHDFFVVKKIKLPATLTLGRYLLHVIVEDQQSHRMAEQTIPLEIVGRKSVEE